MELSKLIPAGVRLERVEKRLQEQMVVDLSRGDRIHAGMLGEELLVIRRVSKLVMDMKIIYEMLILRIGTMSDWHEFMHAMNPALASLKSVQADLEEVMPEARDAFTRLSDMFSDTLEATTVVNEPIGFDMNDDALGILEEASKVVEEELQKKLPALPEIESETDLEAEPA